MATAFLWNNRIASAVYFGDLGPAAIAALPLSNVLDPQPRVRARWVTPTGIQVWIDLGASLEVACVALISTTLGLAGGAPTVRARLSDDVLFATAAWDTGAVAASTDAYANGNVILVHPTSATGRHLRVDIDDPSASVVDVGRIVAGPLWRPGKSWEYGAQEGRLVLDKRTRNVDTGAEFPVPAVGNPRQAVFNLPYISRADAVAQWRLMLDALGGVGDALWVPDDALSQSELNRRSIWGAATPAGGSALLARASFVHHARQFTLVERL
jgi:hypothetical protein